VSESTAATQGIDLSALYIIEYNVVGVLSESYGACEAAIGTGGNAFYNSLWGPAAAQGSTASCPQVMQAPPLLTTSTPLL
jgi:hypothetical protein